MSNDSSTTIESTFQEVDRPISPHLSKILRPLSSATASLLVENKKIYATDRLSIGIQDTAGEHQRFVMIPYAIQHNGDDDISSVSWPKMYPSYEAASRWFQKIPGATLRYSGDGCTAPVTDITVLVTLATWGKDRITFESEEARMNFWVILGAFMKNQKVAEYQARYKAYGEIPLDCPPCKDGITPMKHQPVVAKCLLEAEAFQLFMEMRTGKTLPCIMAMDQDSEAHLHAMNLIIAPKNVRVNWRNELETFSRKNVNVVILRGGKLRRMKLLLEAFQFRTDYDYTVVIASYEGASKTKLQLSAFNWRWGILDESHFIKEPTTERWKTMKVMRGVCAKRVCLTGTPICNTAFDLYTQFEWLGDGQSGFSSFDAFKAFYGTWVTKGDGKANYSKMLVGMRNMPLLQERIARSAFLLTMKEALPNLPPMTHTIVEAEMTKHQSQVYKEVATKLYAEIEDELADESSPITVNNILTKLLRLAQISAGFVAVDGDIDIDTGEVLSRDINHFDPNPKIEELLKIIAEREPTSKIIVWSCFVPTIKTVRARLELEGIECATFFGKTKDADREEAIRRFNNDPNCRVFLGNPKAGGVGINLNGRCPDENGVKRCQADTVVYLVQGWEQPVRTQSEVRGRDKDCDWSTEIIDILAVTDEGDTCLDTEILDRVLGKRNHANTVQDIRAMLKKLL